MAPYNQDIPKLVAQTINGYHQNKGSKKRVAIIGAGVSGILSIKACKEEEDFFEEIVCYEKTTHSGGLWRFRDSSDFINNNNGPVNKVKTVTVMESTVANSSKEMSAFSDFPPDPKTPNYMHHKVMLQYIESYAKNFDCLKHIRYNHEILEISQAKGSPGYQITVRDHSNSSAGSKEKSLYYDYVMVCTGHHGRPYFPQFPGKDLFKGKFH